MDMPPTRYRVVEQGRRLVVIDRWSGEPVRQTTAPRPLAAASRPVSMEASRQAAQRAPKPAGPPAGFTGGPAFRLETQGWFDAKGPRAILVGQEAQGQLVFAALIAFVVLAFALWLIGWPLVVVLGVALAQPKVRLGIRTALTVWLDSFERPA